MTKRKARRAAQSGNRKVSKALQDLAQSLEADIEKVAGMRMGFALLVFSPIPGNLPSSLMRRLIGGA